MRFLKIFCLYGVERHKVEKWSGKVGSLWVWWVWWVCVGDGAVVSGSVDTIHWIVDVMSFQKMYGLYGLKNHIVGLSYSIRISSILISMVKMGADIHYLRWGTWVH